jgi:carbamoyltransferase
MNVLGITASHNSGACLLSDGRLLASSSEERFNRKKGFGGFPINAVKYCLQSQRIRPEELDAVAVAGYHVTSLQVPTYFTLDHLWHETVVKFAPRLANSYRVAQTPLGKLLTSNMRKKRKEGLSELLGVSPDKIYGVEHHLCHAYAALFSSPFPSEGKDVLVLTADGSGDNKSSTISTFEGGKFQMRTSTDAFSSVGVLYSAVTRFLGMRIDEDEYKVMGLAPYASNSKGEEVYRQISQIITFNPETLRFNSELPSTKYIDEVKSKFERTRFDFLAYGVQKLTEELLLSMARAAVKRFKIPRLACGGGTFMNVKANMRIAQMPEVAAMFVMPSAGDESNAIGAAYYVHLQLCPDEPIHPLESLYLGPEYTDAQMHDELMKHEFRFEKVPDIEREVSHLLSEHKITARFSGRMEFGARALGNRSILADPSDPTVVQEINRQIKGRDFWMPFAPVILKNEASSYLATPDSNRVNSDSMIFAFETHPRSRKELVAAIHPYDKTVRPQVLFDTANSGFFKIVSGFKERRGIGGLLNTSFNLHGEPIVCSPADALHTFKNSGLEYLALGPFLVSKTG